MPKLFFALFGALLVVAAAGEEILSKKGLLPRPLIHKGRDGESLHHRALIAGSEPCVGWVCSIFTGADGAKTAYAIDLNSDGHVDVLSASANDDAIRWYQNDGAATPSFTEHHRHRCRPSSIRLRH